MSRLECVAAELTGIEANFGVVGLAATTRDELDRKRGLRDTALDAMILNPSSTHDATVDPTIA